MTECQIRLPQKHRGGLANPEHHLEALRHGYPICQDTYFVGMIKGVERIYMQSVLDAYCSLGFAKLYLSKVPMTAVDVLIEQVIPFYDDRSIQVDNLQTDNGSE